MPVSDTFNTGGKPGGRDHNPKGFTHWLVGQPRSLSHDGGICLQFLLEKRASYAVHGSPSRRIAVASRVSLSRQTSIRRQHRSARRLANR